MACYLPVILESLNANRHHYLLLSTLKEVIVLHANTTGLDFGPYIEQVLPHLLKVRYATLRYATLRYVIQG